MVTHDIVLNAFQFELAYGLGNFENFQNITCAHKSRNALALMRFAILNKIRGSTVPFMVSRIYMSFSGHSYSLPFLFKTLTSYYETKIDYKIDYKMCTDIAILI